MIPVLAQFDPISAIIMVAVSIGMQMALSKSSRPPRSYAGFQLNKARLGDPVPVIFGTTRVKDLVAVTPIYRYDYRAIKKTVLWNTSIIGWKYYISAQLALGHAHVNVRQLWANGRCAWPTPNDPTVQAADGLTRLHIQAGDLFGEYSTGGGIDGYVTVLPGGSSQGLDAYLGDWLGAGAAPSRGLTTINLENLYVGTSGAMPQIEVLASRTLETTDETAMWYPAKAAIGDDMNLIHALYEVLTSRTIGKGLATALIDDANFRAAADVLYAEGLGISFEWFLSEQSADELIDLFQEIGDFAFYQDPADGLFKIALYRPDYDPDTLDEFTEADFWIEDYEPPVIGAIPPYTAVLYWDTLNDKQAIAYDDDIAMQAVQGYNPNPQEFKYPMVRDRTVATAIAARKQLMRSCLPYRWRIHALRTMKDLHRGSVFRAISASLGISKIVRVAAINYGTVANGEVILDLLDDPYGVTYATFAPPPAPAGEPISGTAEDVTDYLLIETPFYSLARDLYGLSGALDLPATAGFLLVAPVKPQENYYDTDLWVRDAATLPFEEVAAIPFSPAATVAAAIPQAAADITVTLSDAIDLDLVAVGSYAQLGAELFGVVALDADTLEVTLSRGVLDTVPVAHAAGGRLYFLAAAFIHDHEYTSGDTPAVKFLPRSGGGQLDYDDATARTAAALAGRAARPYPPGNFQINGSAYPATFSGDLVLSWSARDRTDPAQLAALVKQTDSADYGPEAGTTYTVEIYDAENNLIHTESALATTTFTYTEAAERSDCGLSPTDPLNSHLRVRLWSIRATLDSWQRHDVTIARSGGRGFGQHGFGEGSFGGPVA